MRKRSRPKSKRLQIASETAWIMPHTATEVPTCLAVAVERTKCKRVRSAGVLKPVVHAYMLAALAHLLCCTTALRLSIQACVPCAGIGAGQATQTHPNAAP